MALGVLKCWLRGERVCVLDVPLLIETKIYQWVGRVVVIYCSAEIQLQRLMQRDKSTRDDARARLQAQLPIADKLEYADIVVDNSGTKQSSRFKWPRGWTWRLKWLIPPFGLFSAMWTLIWRGVKRARRSKRQGGQGQ
ncbi:dephospho-CoA kinase-domain-containing protein [Russula compacta]|nr:dephospho-CoA kinase-domain-containing protein [Russula compacta]